LLRPPTTSLFNQRAAQPRTPLLDSHVPHAPYPDPEPSGRERVRFRSAGSLPAFLTFSAKPKLVEAMNAPATGFNLGIEAKHRTALFISRSCCRALAAG
jgi:hypothetical protein